MLPVIIRVYTSAILTKCNTCVGAFGFPVEAQTLRTVDLGYFLTQFNETNHSLLTDRSAPPWVIVHFRGRICSSRTQRNT